MRRPGDPRADALLRRHLAVFAGSPLPVPVLAIAEDLLGLRVRERDALGASGMLVAGERLIVVNASESALRRRFTVAHEIGHWILHCGAPAPPPILCRSVTPRPGVDVREREANVFAAELLMPEPELRAAADHHADPTALAAAFGVSEEAMAWRRFNVGLVDHPPPA